MVCMSFIPVLRGKGLGLWCFSFNPGAGKVNPLHHWLALTLSSLTPKSFSHAKQQQGGFRVLLLLWCPKWALGQGTAQMCRHVPHGAGTAEGIISMQDVVQAPSSVVTLKQLWFLQLYLGAGALIFSHFL